MNTQQIINDEPFKEFIRITNITSLAGRAAISGQTFQVVDEHGKKYKLRACSNIDKAKKIENNVKRMPHAFPKFYGRDNNYVLFDWVEGILLTKKAPLQIYYQLGKLVGEAHELNDISSHKSAQRDFEALLETIEQHSTTDKEFLKALKKTFKKLKKQLRVDIVLEFSDIHGDNFIIENHKDPVKARLLYIDEEGFKHKMKGLGLARPLVLRKMSMSDEEEKEFWKGYQEHHSKDYFDQDYQKLMGFVQLVRSMAAQLEIGNDVANIRKQLEAHI